MASIFHKRNGSWEPVNSEVVFSEDGIAVYETTAGHKAVDAANGSSLFTISGQTEPNVREGAVIDGNLTTYIITSTDAIATEVDGTEKWSKSSFTSGNLVGVDINSNGNIVVGSNDGEIVVLDSSDGTEISSNTGLSVNPVNLKVAGGFAYVSPRDSNTISKLDISSGSVDASFTDPNDNETDRFDVNSSGNVVYHNGTDFAKLDSNLVEVWRVFSDTLNDNSAKDITYKDNGVVWRADIGNDQIMKSIDNGSTVDKDTVEVSVVDPQGINGFENGVFIVTYNDFDEIDAGAAAYDSDGNQIFRIEDPDATISFDLPSAYAKKGILT